MITKPSMPSPKVSVLMPTYNYARFLPEAIESVLTQDFRDFELIIIDDCSTDDTRQVCEAWRDRDKRIQFMVNPANLGMVNNWNRCLAEARAGYVKFLFGDDKLARPDALGKMMGMLASHPSATLAASARSIIDDRSATVDLWQTMPEGCHEGVQAIMMCLAENANLIGEPSVVLFRKEDAWPGFNLHLRQLVDLEMWFRLLERGRLVYTREPLCAFRRHDLQQTASNNACGRSWDEHSRLFAQYLQKSWLPGGKQKARKFQFEEIYETRKQRRRKNAPPPPNNRNLPTLNKGWYAFYWLERKITRPFANLADALRKRRRP